MSLVFHHCPYARHTGSSVCTDRLQLFTQHELLVIKCYGRKPDRSVQQVHCPTTESTKLEIHSVKADLDKGNRTASWTSMPVGWRNDHKLHLGHQDFKPRGLHHCRFKWTIWILNNLHWVRIKQFSKPLSNSVFQVLECTEVM